MTSQMRAALAAACLGALAAAGPARAHAQLEKAQPRVGSTVATPPHEVVLTFTQSVEPAFSKVEVTGPAGVPAQSGAVHAAGDDPRTLAVAVGPLAAGTYFVTWHVTSTDTHKAQGRFPFTVAP